MPAKLLKYLYWRMRVCMFKRKVNNGSWERDRRTQEMDNHIVF